MTTKKSMLSDAPFNVGGKVVAAGAAVAAPSKVRMIRNQVGVRGLAAAGAVNLSGFDVVVIGHDIVGVAS